jgi:hypothetical protein
MGIYFDGKIYGLRWFHGTNPIFEEIYETEIPTTEFARILGEFEKVKNNTDMYYQYYTEATSTHDGSHTFMMWTGYDKESLEKYLTTY